MAAYYTLTSGGSKAYTLNKLIMTDEEQTTNVDLEAQFKFYLDKIKMSPESMSRIQYIETRRAFYAGWAQFIRIILHGFYQKPDEWAEVALTAIETQVKDFWDNENKNTQAKYN